MKSENKLRRLKDKLHVLDTIWYDPSLDKLNVFLKWCTKSSKKNYYSTYFYNIWTGQDKLEFVVAAWSPIRKRDLQRLVDLAWDDLH